MKTTSLPQAVESKAASLLEKTGVFANLEAACLTMAGTDPDLIRSMMISVTRPIEDESVDQAVRRFAQEHCVIADIEQCAGAMVIRLTRAEETATDGNSVKVGAPKGSPTKKRFWHRK